MSTGDKKVNIYLKKFLPQEQITENFLDYLEKLSRDTLFKVFGGTYLLTPNPSFTPPMNASVNDQVNFVTPMEGVDGSQGHLLVLDPIYASNVAFENANGVDYYTGLKYFTLPVQTEINVRTGEIKYTFFEEAIGQRGVPDTVTHDGDGTLTIIVDSVTEAGVSNAGRKVKVWKKIPLSQVPAVTFEELTVQWDGSNNYVETAAAFGQQIGNISEIAADYECALMGPLIKRNTDLRLDPNVVFTGIINGNGPAAVPASFDFTDVNTFFDLGSIGTLIDSVFGFLVDGGTITWDLSAEELSWGSTLRYVLPHKNETYLLAAQTISSLADGEMIYFTKDGVGGAASVTKVAVGSMPNDPASEPIAMRSGNDIFFANGALQLTGDASTPTSGRIDGVTVDLLNFMGADDESDADPDYQNALGPSIGDYKVQQGVSLTRGIKELEQRTDIVPRAAAIDIVSSVLPSGANPVVDGHTVVNGDDIMFTNSAIEGIYRASNIGVSVVWTKLYAWGQTQSPGNNSMVSVEDGSTHFQTLWKRVNGSWKQLETTEASFEETGFKDRDESEISFDDGTRTFSIAPKAPATYFDFYERGKPFRFDSSQDIVIPDNEGLHFIYFNDGVLTSTQTFNEDIIRKWVFVATIQWDVANQEAIILGEERHGMTMDGVTHAYLHNTQGMRYVRGLALAFTLDDGADDEDAQVSLSDGEVFDEDLDHSIVDNPAPSEPFQQILDPIAEIPVYYRDGVNGDWRRISATQFPVHLDTGVPQFNDTSGPYALAGVPDGDHYAMWLFATNNINEPIIAIMGQRTDTVLNDALANNTYETLLFGDLPSLEMKVLYRLILEYDSTFANSVSSRIVDVRDLRTASDVSLGAYTPSAHNNLSGRTATNSHPTTAIQTTANAWGGTLRTTDINVQLALDTIDKYFSQLQLREHPSNKSLVIVTGASEVKTDNTVLGQKIAGLLMGFDGARINVQTGEVFESDGVTPLGIDFTPPPVPATEWGWIGVNVVPSVVQANDTISVQLLITAPDPNVAGAFGAVKDDAKRAPFAGNISLGQIALQRNAGDTAFEDVVQANIVQLGVGSGGEGGGAGDVTDIQTRLDDDQDNGLYELSTSNIIAVDEQEKEESSTASFNIVDKVYNFTAGQNFITVELIDFNEFDEEKDISKVKGFLFQKIDGDVDPAAILQASRNGGDKWQSFNLERNGNTDEFNDEIQFEDETDAFQQVFATTTTPIELNATNQVQLSQRLTLTKRTTLTELKYSMSKLGTPAGRFGIKIVRDDGSNLPSNSSLDELYRTPSLVSVDDLGGAAALYTFEIEELLKLEPGQYHVVVFTDSEYQASFSTGVDAIRVHGVTAGGSGEASSLSGAVWSSIAGGDLAHEFNGTTRYYQTIDENPVGNESGTPVVLNATTQQQLAQSFVTTNPIEVFQRLKVYLAKTGTPTGNIQLTIAEDDSGSPGTIVSRSNIQDIEELSASQEVIFDMDEVPKKPGTYHIVLESDAEYKSSFSAGVDEIAVRIDDSGTLTDAQSYNGTVWAPITDTAFLYVVEGRTLSLKLRVEATAAMQMTAIGVHYDKLAGEIISGEYVRQDFFFEGSAPPAEFEITNFEPISKFLVMVDPDTGQYFRVGGRGNAIQLIGNKVVFPDDFVFDDRPYHLFVEHVAQVNGIVEPDLLRTVADNYLASTIPEADFGVAGRGMKTRQKLTGDVVEWTVDENGDIELYKVT